MTSHAAKLDSQQTELFGRHRVIESMARDGIEVALPLRDSGVDFVAFINSATYIACPVQLKVATQESFSINKKYASAARLLMCHVWHIHDEKALRIYALSYVHAIRIAEEMGWTKTKSWMVDHAYSTSSPGKKLKNLLEEHAVRPGMWKGILEKVASS